MSSMESLALSMLEATSELTFAFRAAVANAQLQPTSSGKGSASASASGDAASAASSSSLKPSDVDISKNVAVDVFHRAIEQHLSTASSGESSSSYAPAVPGAPDISKLLTEGIVPGSGGEDNEQRSVEELLERALCVVVVRAGCLALMKWLGDAMQSASAPSPSSKKASPARAAEVKEALAAAARMAEKAAGKRPSGASNVSIDPESYVSVAAAWIEFGPNEVLATAETDRTDLSALALGLRLGFAPSSKGGKAGRRGGVDRVSAADVLDELVLRGAQAFFQSLELAILKDLHTFIPARDAELIGTAEGAGTTKGNPKKENKMDLAEKLLQRVFDLIPAEQLKEKIKNVKTAISEAAKVKAPKFESRPPEEIGTVYTTIEQLRDNYTLPVLELYMRTHGISKKNKTTKEKIMAAIVGHLKESSQDGKSPAESSSKKRKAPEDADTGDDEMSEPEEKRSRTDGA